MQEKDWTILEMIFRKLPKLLQNKTLILQGNCGISSLCSALCRMVSIIFCCCYLLLLVIEILEMMLILEIFQICDRNIIRPENLKNTPQRLTRTDIHGHIYPCVSALTSYHATLQSFLQVIFPNYFYRIKL